MVKQIYLKDKNLLYLGLFISVNIVFFLFFCISTQLTYSSLEHFWQRVSEKDGLIAICIPLATIVLNGILSDLAKARLVFWRWNNPLPGCRVFTELMKIDPRINEGVLKNKYGKLPRTPKEQNALWYRIYKMHSDNLTVCEAHRIYLLTRDMTALSAILTFIFLVGIFVAPISRNIMLSYCIILFVQYLILSASARNYGNRFVLNVLTEESVSLI